jgi:hypothetical protein
MKVIYKKFALKSLLVFGLFILINSTSFAQQSVSIGDTQIKSNAVLYLKGSGTQGLIIPVTSDHNSVTKTIGMIVFDSGDGQVYSSDGNTWKAMGGGSGSVSYTLTLTGNNLILKDGSTTISTVPLSSASPSANQFLMWDGTKWIGTTLSQDIANTNGTITVNGLKTKALPALPGAGTQALVYDASTSAWKFQSIAAGGTVTQVTAGIGLTGGPITTTGTLNVDVGTTANKIVQLDASAKLPAVDGSQLTNLPSITSAKITDGTIATVDIAAGAITGGTSGVIADGTITNADISSTAAIAVTKIAPGTNGQILSTSAGVPTWVNSGGGTDSQDLSLAGTTLSLTNDASPVTLGGLSILSAVGSTEITDGSISNVDVSSTAAIAVTKIAPGTNGQVLTTTAGVPTWGAAGTDTQDLSLTGTTLSLTNDGTPVVLGGLSILSTVGSTEITNASVAAVDLANSSVSGGAGGVITDATIVNADIAAAAAIAVTKIAPGTNGQVLTTTAGVPTWGAAGTDTQDLSLTGTTLSLTNDGTPVVLGGLSILSTVGSTEITNASVAAVDLANSSVSGGAGGVITDATIVNADIAAAAAIAVTKIAPGTNGQVLTTTGGVPAWGAAGTDTQDLSLTGTTLSLTNDGTPVVLGGLSILSTVGSTEITNASVAAVDLANSSVSGGAGGVITDATIVNADIAAAAAIAVTKIAPGTNGQVLTTTAGIPTWGAAGTDTQDLSLTGTTLSLTNDGTPVVLGGLSILGAVGSTEITDGSIVNADVSATAAIAVTKIAPGTNGQVLTTTGGVPTWGAAGTDTQDLSLTGTTLSLTNDGTPVVLGGLSILSAVGSTEITNASVAAVDLANSSVSGGAGGVITDATIVNADIAAAAAIAVTKIAPGTNGQVLTTTGGVPTWGAAGTDTQDLSLTGTTLSLTNDGTPVVLGGLSILGAVGSTEITDGSIVNADVSATAAIAVTKIAPGTNGQVLTTTGGVPTWGAAGTDTQDLSLTGTTLSLTNDGTPVVLGGLSILSTVGSTEITNASVAAVDLANSSVSGGAGGVITDATIVNADIAAAAAIAVTKIAPGTNGQVLTTTGGVPTWGAAGSDSQDLSLTGTTLSLTNDGTPVVLGGLSILGAVGSTEITDGSIVNTDVSATAAIAGTKISPDFGNQNITTTGKTVFNTVGYTWTNTQGAAGTYLQNDGSGALSWVAVGGSSLISNTGSGNLFAGTGAGTNNTGSNEAFFGSSAGAANTSGDENTFIGRNAGLSNTTGSYNVYVGKDAGKLMQTGNLNTFVGYLAGDAATGISAGTFLGRDAGGQTTSGDNNTFIGERSGFTNITGNSNTMLGKNADVGSGALANATALGYNTKVNASNSLVLGTGANVGVDLPLPANRLHINNTTAANTYAQITNSLTGTTSADGLLLGVSSTGIATINYQEANDFKIMNNSNTPIWMNSTGHTGIGGAPDASHTFLAYGSNEAIGIDNLAITIGDVGGNSSGNYFKVDFESTPGLFTFMGADMGIGTTSPTAFVNIVPQTGDTGYGVRIEQGSTGDGLLCYVNTTSASRTIFNASGNTTGFTVLGDGSAAIGAGTPVSSKFEVLNSNSGIYVEHLDASYAGGTAGLIRFSRSNALTGSITENAGTISYNAFTGSHFAHIDQSIDRGMLVTLTGKNILIPGNMGEPVYGVVPTSEANDSKILGTYLSELPDVDVPNTHQVMAVGNGEVWVVDNGQDLNIGDYLISSNKSGHAMKENGEFDVAYIFARVAEPINWNDVHETINGVKHAKISIFFETFTKNNKADKLQSEIDKMKADIEYLKQLIGAEAKKEK